MKKILTLTMISLLVLSTISIPRSEVGASLSNEPKVDVRYGWIKWKYNASDSILFSPVVGEDGTIYLITVAGPIYTLHAVNQDGTLKWKYLVECYKVYFAPQVDKDNTVYLYIESIKEERYLLAISNGILKWKCKIEEKRYGGFSPRARVSPILDQRGVIYVIENYGVLEGWIDVLAINREGTLCQRYYLKDTKFNKFTLDQIRSLIGIDNGTLYVLAGARYDGEFDAAFCAIDPSNNVKWVVTFPTYIGLAPGFYHWVASKDAIYVVCSEGSKENADVYLYAVSYDGKIKWKYKADDYWNNRFYSEDNIPLIGNDGTIYLVFGGVTENVFSNIYAVNPDGTLRWKHTLKASIMLSKPLSGRCSAVETKEGTSYLILGTVVALTLYAIDQNGAVKWKYDLGDGTTPFLKIINNKIYIRTFRGGIFYFEGYPIYIFDLNGKLEAETVIEASGITIAEDGTIYYVNYDEENVLYAVSLSPPLKKTMLTMRIEPLKIIEKVSASVAITGRLTNETGVGLGGKTINIYKGSDKVGSCITDSNGYYSYEWKNVYLEKGSYEIVVRFEGDSTYAASSASTTLAVTASILSMSLSEGWQNKELFTPFLIRSEDGVFTMGVFNKRDMWYLVRVYRRMPDKSWQEIFPWELPYLAPYSELTFTCPYELKEGDEIKIEVLNDPNDDGLWSLILLDFAMRALIGVPLPRQFLGITDAGGFKDKLASFYRDFLKPAANDLRQGFWRKAFTEIFKGATENWVFRLLDEILYPWVLSARSWERVTRAMLETKLVSAAGDIAKGLVGAIANAPQWGPLLLNINKEPFREEVIFTVRRVGEPEHVDLKVTGSLTLEQDAPYYCGETIKARFSIRNEGGSPATLAVLTVGGRGPSGEVRDFTLKTNIRLNPGETYNYRGELTLSDSGDHHFFIAYKTLDGTWVTDVPAEAGAKNTLDIFVNPIPDEIIGAELCSPGELRIIDSQGRVTGLVNGEKRSEIPHSILLENIIVVFSPTGSYSFQVVGTSTGMYNLTIARILGNESSLFTATAIPVSPKAIHQYNVNWEALSRGEKGVTIQVDFDGDGKFDEKVSSGGTLTQEEFPRPEGLPNWILVAVAGIIIITIASSILILKRRRQELPSLPPSPS